MKYLWCLMVIVLLACGQEESASSSVRGASSGRDNNSEAVALPEFDAPIADQLSLPTAFDGTLYFVFERDLYKASFDGEPASIIVENVEPSSVQVSPDGEMFIFSRSLDVYAYNLADGAKYKLGGGGIFPPKIQSWSPDGNWLILSASEPSLIITSRDGQRQITVSANNTPGVAFAGWLENNTVLVYTDSEPENPAQVNPPEVFVVNPETGEKTDIEFVPDTFAFALTNLSYLSTANDFLSENGFFKILPTRVDGLSTPTIDRATQLDVVPPVDPKDPTQVRRAAFTDTGACFAWEIVTRSVDPTLANMPTVIFEEYAARLTNLTLAADGSLFFLRWNVPDCDRNNEPTVSLMHVRSDFKVMEVSNQVLAPGNYSMNYPFESLFFATVQPFAVSPDGSFVVWTEGHAVKIAETGTYQSIDLLSSETGDFQAIFWLT